MGVDAQAPAPTARRARCPVPASSARRDQAGAVAAETAAVLPVLVAVALGLTYIVGLTVAQLRVTDAAREVARLAARAEGSDVKALEIGRVVAPDGAKISIGRNPQIRVEVTATFVGPGGLLNFLGGPELQAVAYAEPEPASVLP